jgi:ADP-ribose pyrophosphatase YjhB (NUDIX family)
MITRDAKTLDTSAFPSAFSSYVPRSRKVYGCILFSPNEKVLLVRGKLSGKWSLPKGHMEGRENDLQCALRELHEETGIVPNVKYSYFKKFAAGGYFIYFMENEPMPQIQSNQEISEAGWFEISEIRKLSCNLDLNCFFRWMKKNCLPADEYSKTPCLNTQDPQQDPIMID